MLHYQSKGKSWLTADNVQDRGKVLPEFKIKRKSENKKMTFIVDECMRSLRGGRQVNKGRSFRLAGLRV